MALSGVLDSRADAPIVLRLRAGRENREQGISGPRTRAAVIPLTDIEGTGMNVR